MTITSQNISDRELENIIKIKALVLATRVSQKFADDKDGCIFELCTRVIRLMIESRKSLDAIISSDLESEKDHG